MRLLIEQAAAGDGLKLTATGNLSRADVRVLFDALSWPDYDKANILALNKVLNEADVGPVEITRRVAQEAKLLGRRQGRIRATKLGATLAQSSNALALFRLLFTVLFWRVNLGYFDRVPVEGWPQDHIGLVLWCLSASADRWSRAVDLVEVSTVRDPRFGAYEFDFRGFAMESRVLRPLTWLGLMESRADAAHDSLGMVTPRLYRKTPLFDRLLTFDVDLRDVPAGRH
ncbi:hypothetical protein SAMN02799636_04295 [Methylobacterium sp. 275MFSha3.1]|nr:hypothetical protein SAMN02799636_04295 [Methylobacterium sp. 275MFSha3.1]